MKVSVIIPTYNRSQLVCRAVDSAAQQTGAEVELIIVDDGSTDTTRTEVERLAKTGALPIHYMWKANGGCASARNVGLRAATGDAFIFLDSDDTLCPDAIRSLANTLANSTADF